MRCVERRSAHADLSIYIKCVVTCCTHLSCKTIIHTLVCSSPLSLTTQTSPHSYTVCLGLTTLLCVYASICDYKCMLICDCTFMYIQCVTKRWLSRHTHTHTHTNTHTHRHIHTHTHTHTHLHTYTHTYTHIHTHAHTHTHTQTHTKRWLSHQRDIQVMSHI